MSEGGSKRPSKAERKREGRRGGVFESVSEQLIPDVLQVSEFTPGRVVLN